MGRPIPDVIWQPSTEAIERAAITGFARRHGLPEGYHALWRWSVDHLDEFWALIWDDFGVEGTRGKTLGSRSLPGAEWFPGATTSYARQFFTGKPDERVAIRFASELAPLTEWTWSRLSAETARIASGLRELGVGPGDRVCGVLPNIPEAIAALLATSSVGAIWSCAAPEFGAKAIIDRFQQIEPAVLLTVDGYRYGGRDHDCAEKGTEVAGAVPEAAVVPFGHLSQKGWPATFGSPGASLSFLELPFGHPLWVLYSSGTTGLPKGIVHSQGGILLEHLKKAHLHLDCTEDDRVFWFTTTGWMMWNFLVGVLLTDASIVLYDGSPAGEALWELAEQAGITVFGVSAAYIGACRKAGIEPRRGRALTGLRAVGSTGSPLPPEGFSWVGDALGTETWLFSTSGGTDLCTAFVGGVPTLPVYRGELQARSLGASVEAWDEDGNAVVDQVGELVLTKPMPSMPIRLWGDDDGSRLRESYFSTYPGVWRHGDWIEITNRGTAIITGRSDSTINRGGVRMGTSELYRVVLDEPEIADALAVDLAQPGGESRLLLFVALASGAVLGDELTARLRTRIRTDCSPRHVPDEITQVPEVPRTLSGKTLEIPVKRILEGVPPELAASRESLANPAALDWFVARTTGAPGASGSSGV
ncbi:MAG: acetoacetate--CoA ligase [Gaiella sp.]